MDNNNDGNCSKVSKTLYSNKMNPIIVKKRESSKRGNYILGETIGQGAFAKVKLATHMYTQEKVAIKILNKTKLIEKSKDIVRIQKEINILKRLRHKNIIQLYEIMESASSLYIVMDYCEGKELFDFIIKRKRLTEREACRFFQQIINGVEYLHLQNITHRDLKPENLLLDNKKRIKISDFGLSTISEECDSLLQTPCGTPSYAPPEMLRGDEYNGIPSDIWSCGIILYTMLCGNLPCAESKEELIYQCFMNKSYDYPSYLSNSVTDLLGRLLKFNPNERISFDQIKKHPWFNLVRPQLKPGIIVGVQKIPLDAQILNQVELFGYDKQKCLESVSLNKYDELCSIYYFILKKFAREGRSSISDMHSEEFEKYIRDIKNWEHQEDIEDFKYKDYWVEKAMSRNDICKLDLLALSDKEHNNSQSSIVNSQNSMGNSQNSVINSQNSIEERSSILTLQSNQMIETYFKKKFEEEIKKNNMFSDNDTSMNSVNNNIPFIKSSSNNTIPKQITFTSSSKKGKARHSFYSQIKQEKKPKQEKQENDSLMDKLDESQKQLFKASLIKANKKFKNEMEIIDNCTLGNSNIIPLLARKMIKTTVFGKHLLNRKPKKVYKGELEERFYLVQKYKNLIEIFKSRKANLFPKKIYDWNYNALDDYFYDEEDYIFGDNFKKSNINLGFMDNLMTNIKFKSLFNARRFLSKNFSSKRNGSFFKFERYSAMKSDKSSFKKRLLKKCIMVPTSLFIQDTSVDRSISLPPSGGNNMITFPPLPFKSKYSSSTMNDISEDEELIQMNNTPNKQQNCVISPKGIPISKIPLTLTENLFNNDIRARTKYLQINDNSKNNSFLIDNKIKHNQTFISTINTESNPTSKRRSNVLDIQNKSVQYDSPSRNLAVNNQNHNPIANHMNQPSLLFSSINNNSKPLFTLTSMNTSSNLKISKCKYYEGPVDFFCVFSFTKDTLILLIKQYFKKIDYFCKVNNNLIRCSKANITIEIEILTLKDTAMSYLKLKQKKGEGIHYQKTINGLIKSLQHI